MLLVALFFGGAYVAWQAVHEEVATSERYWLTQSELDFTPPEAWIDCDVGAEVFRDASLDGPLSILDDQLTSRIANAFSLHPWVEKVVRVTKRYPARVEVEVLYRRPVCVVQVPGQLVPVDVHGVLLPDDFSPAEARRYPRLVGVDTAPVGPVGSCWGDVRVIAGAEIAAALGDAWPRLGLDRIVPSALVEIGRGDEYQYELITRGGTRIFWGSGPGMQTADEIPVSDKVDRLVQYHKSRGTLEGPHGPQQLDVRRLDPSGITSRTAGKKEQELR